MMVTIEVHLKTGEVLTIELPIQIGDPPILNDVEAARRFSNSLDGRDPESVMHLGDYVIFLKEIAYFRCTLKKETE